MKKASLVYPIMQNYTNRNYIGGELDQTWFDLQNEGTAEGPFFAHAIGCLDALDAIPAGSMHSNNIEWYGMSTVCRGRTLAEEKEIEDFIKSLMRR